MNESKTQCCERCQAEIKVGDRIGVAWPDKNTRLILCGQCYDKYDEILDRLGEYKASEVVE